VDLTLTPGAAAGADEGGQRLELPGAAEFGGGVGAQLEGLLQDVAERAQPPVGVGQLGGGAKPRGPEQTLLDELRRGR
jgi:hypothetical protein